MTDQHPITPPPELVEQWSVSSPIQHSDESWAYELFIAHRAAQWGADQELEACCDTLQRHAHWDLAVCELMADRRPKPPSLKEQLLQKLEHIRDVADKYQDTQNAIDDLRETLEALPND